MIDLELLQVQMNRERQNGANYDALAGARAFLVDIILEQIKSVKEFAEHVTKLELALDNGAALLWLDAKLGEVK